MNGLQVVQTEYITQTAFYQSAPGVAPVTPAQGPMITVCMDPGNLRAAMNQIGSDLVNEDAKFFLRQYKSYGIIQNISNTPIYLKRTSFRVRKSIAFADYANYNEILLDGAVLPYNPLAEITTGNPAQRLLKFGKVKWMYMPCGAMRRYKLNTKFYSPKAISKDVEGNTLYLANRHTKGYFWKVIPCVNQHFTGTLPNITLAGQAFGSFLVALRGIDYISGYVQGNNDPRTFFNPVALPSATTRLSIFTDQEARIQSAFVPAQ